MKTYQVNPRGAKAFRVKAEDYTQASNRAAKRLYGRACWGQRESGDPAKSGWFVAVTHNGRRHKTVVQGEPFFLCEAALEY